MVKTDMKVRPTAGSGVRRWGLWGGLAEMLACQESTSDPSL
jgi:hypothetical protein